MNVVMLSVKKASQSAWFYGALEQVKTKGGKERWKYLTWQLNNINHWLK